MKLRFVRVYAALVGGLAILGLFISGHLFGILNVDATLDLVRLLLVIYLAYVAFMSHGDEAVNTALLIVGVFYLGLGALALITPTLGGLLPSGLTGFDIVFHLIGGGPAVYAAGTHNQSRSAAHR